MKRNQELADFEVDPATCEVHVLDVHAAGDDLFSCEGRVRQNADRTLAYLVKRRAISSSRPDRQSILDAFGAHSAVELALKGHGLSLSDLYWYRSPGSTDRWEDINFFDNEWDPGFGAAVLSEDYAGLAACSPDVPEATTSGHAAKAWERDGDGISLVKASFGIGGADVVGAKLASDMCSLLFDEGCYVPLRIVDRCGRTCTAGPLMLSGDEELVDGRRLCAIAGVREVQREDARITPEVCDTRIDAYAAMGIQDASAHVARMATCSCLSLLSDFHAGNFGAIRKADSGTWRAAPIFDYDGSFGCPFSENLISSLCKYPDLAKLLCAHAFSYLKPSWDWSWYDPHALDGFEDRIVEAYASWQDLPPNFGELVALLFAMQRNYVNDITATR